MRSRANRFLSAIIVASIILNQAFSAYAGERSLWEERRQEQNRRSAHSANGLLAMASGTTFPIRSDLASSLPNPEKVIALAGLTKPANLPQGIGESYRRFFSAVPLANATIRKISLPSDHRPHGLVFHIQDVHRNREAQTNISNVVTALIKEPSGSSSIALVGLEGEFRPYRLGWLRSFPEPNAFRLAAEEMLVQDRLSGPMLSLLTAPHPIPSVVGIDDKFHYTANLDAYRRSLPLKEAVQTRLAIEKKSLEDEKLSAFNPALLDYDKSVQDYQKGMSPLSSYVHTLNRKAGSPLGESLTLFLRALHMEETLNFKQVEAERTQLLEILSHQLSRPQINDLIAQSLSYRAGQIYYGDFYRWIMALCQKAGVSLGRFPAMEGYIQYVLLAEGIDAEALFQDCRKREKEIYTLLAKTGPEQALVERSHRLSLILKLTHFSLTPEEWADYERMIPPQTPVLDLEPYESFYHEAIVRDTSMAKNFLSALNRAKGGGSSDISPLVSILVTGGYHGPGLAEKLTQAGMAVVSIVPKIEKVDTAQGSAYLSVFAQEKTPLDKLFEGAKLFVADKPLSERSAATLAMGAAAVAVREKGALSNNILAFLNQQFKNVQLAIEKNVIKFRFGFGKQNESGTFDDSKIAGQRIIMDPPSNDWTDRWQAAMESSRPTRLAQEIPLFFSATLAPALLFGVSLYFGLGPWTAMAQAIVGIGFAQGNWPAFREAHRISQTNWLAKNPGKTVSDYQKNLLKRYWSIVLVSQISAIALALCFLGNPVTTGSETIWKTVTVGAFSLFFGPFLFHGTQNFIGTFRHGPAYVPAMAERDRSSSLQQQRGQPWINLSQIPIGFLKGQTVVIRTNQDELGAKTIQSLVETGAKVVVVSHESISESFIKTAGIDSPRFLKGEVQSKDWRWLSVADKTAIENMDEGQVLLLQNAGQDWRANDPDLSKGKEMAMELAGIDPDQIFVLDVPPTSDSAPGPVKSIASFIPGVRGLSIETDSDLSTLWGWDPTRSLSRGTVGNEGWASLLHDPNNRKYVFIIDEKKGSYQAILRQRTINPSQDLFGQIMGFIQLQNKVNAAFGNKLTPNGKPIPDNFVKIQEDGTTVNYIVFTKNGNHSVYQSDVPDEVMDDPETVLIINQNTKRASRPGGTVTKVSEISANNNLEMYKFTPNYVKAQLPIELYSEWRSKAKQLWIFTCNPFPYFPNHLNRTPKDDVDHIMISRGDKHVPQAEISSLESLTDVFEAMDELNSSPKMKGKIPFHLGINGWYYGKDFKAGASQNHAHAHLLRERFPVQHAPIQITGTTNGVQIGVLADPENGPGLVLEASRGNFNALIKTTHEVVSRITAKGHSFNILAIPINGGYRVIIADKIGGVPTHRFQNEFAFAESCGRIIMGDDPRKVFKFTDQQIASFNGIDPTNKPAIIKWVQSEYAAGNLTVDPVLYEETRADIRSVSAPPDQIKALAKEVFLSQNTSRGPPFSSHEILVQRIGGKAVGLMELDEIPEILVPKWTVLPVSIFEQFLQENPSIQEMINNLSSTRNESDQDLLLEKIRSSIESSPLSTSSSIGKTIRDAYQNIAQQTGTANPTVSVRSSSPAEDKTSASYAGQYKTIPDVHGKTALIHAVKQVWASTFSTGAVRYRLKQNPGQVWAPMSVIIQQMIDGQAAGTAFTIDLETGAPGFYTINATLGAGEAEVAGMVTSDRYLVDSSTLETTTRRLGQKDVKISPPRKGENGPQIRPTSERERSNFALNDETVRKLARGIQYIQKHFREKLGITFLDVEFVIDRTGTIYFLQCRPETVWAKKPPMRLTVAGPEVKHLPSSPLGGLTANPGVAQGTLRVISNVGEKGVLQAERVVREGDILVVTHTTNIWERVLAKAGGAITDTGGPGCHTAVVARESGKPAVVGTETSVRDLAPYDGKQVVLDATARVIYVGTLPEQAIIEAPISPPQYEGMDTQKEDDTWLEVVKSGTAIDRGDGIRWIGKPNYALTPFMKEIYLKGHKYIAELLDVPTRLDFFQDIHVIHFSDIFKWREKLRTMPLEDLEKFQRRRDQTSSDFLKRSANLNPRASDFRKWVNSFTKINSFIAVGYSFSRVTEGLLEKALEEKRLQEPYYSQVRTATAGRIGKTESAHFLHLYKGLLEDLQSDTTLSKELSEALLKSAWVPFSKNHETFSELFFRVAYDFKISSRTEPTVALTDPIETLARLLLQDIQQNRQIRIPKQSTEDFFPSDAKFVRIARLSVSAEKAREDAHHLKMRGLWLFRKNMEPFVQWLITNEDIERYEDLFNHSVKWIENKLGDYEREQGLSLDSLLSRKLHNAGKKTTSHAKALGWKWARWTHDFVMAPVYETAIFFLFPAATGSLSLLGVGVIAFVALHFWDDYAGAESGGRSPPMALKMALQAAGPRLLRAIVLYAAPFALFITAPNFFPIFSNGGFPTLFTPSIENPLMKIAGVVALLHAGKNFYKALEGNKIFIEISEKWTAMGLKSQASKEGQLFGKVILGKPHDLGQAMEIINKSFPETKPLGLKNLGSPGMGHLIKLGVNLQQSDFDNAFTSSLQKFISVNSQRKEHFPSTVQALARMRYFADSQGWAKDEGNQTPVELQICTTDDLPTIQETLVLLQEANEKQEKKVYLLLAGANRQTVGALKEAAQGMKYVGVAETPVAQNTNGDENPILVPHLLNSEFNSLRERLKLPPEIVLAVSLSEQITFTNEQLRDVDENQLDKALRAALRRFLFSFPIQPVDFTTMLRILKKAREGIDQSA